MVFYSFCYFYLGCSALTRYPRWGRGRAWKSLQQTACLRFWAGIFCYCLQFVFCICYTRIKSLKLILFLIPVSLALGTRISHSAIGLANCRFTKSRIRENSPASFTRSRYNFYLWIRIAFFQCMYCTNTYLKSSKSWRACVRESSFQPSSKKLKRR